MKWFTASILSLGFIASNVQAAPAAGLALFKLKVASSIKDLSGRYLSSNNNTIGVYPGDDTSAVKVYQTKSEMEGHIQLHTYPIGIVDHALALVGSDGLMNLRDMVNPSATKPDDEVMEYDKFQVSTNNMLTNDDSGRWVALPTPAEAEESWTVRWTDGSAVMPADYMPIEIELESAGEGRWNTE
ncbi:hypothetical protein F4777DRAFT_225743 [Nemania sp. FL0916]|nr:hypothetical protein F4777DRAFT_225743 [Nemania sp. FL0916]